MMMTVDLTAFLLLLLFGPTIPPSIPMDEIAAAFKSALNCTVFKSSYLPNSKVNQTKIKGGCLSGRKVVTHNSKSDLPLVCS